MSREEADFAKVVEGIKLLAVNNRRIFDKFQHLAQSLNFLREEFELYLANFSVVENLATDQIKNLSLSQKEVPTEKEVSTEIAAPIEKQPEEEVKAANELSRTHKSPEEVDK